MTRQQWTAIALIMMLGVAEAHRISMEVDLRNSLEDNHQVMDTAQDLKERMNQLNSKLDHVASGNSFFGFKYCMTTCPVTWVQIAYYQWKMKSNAEALVKEKFGGDGDISRLHTVNPTLAAEYHSTMREAVWTFMKTIDDSAFQRVLLTLSMGPLAAFRFVTGVKPLGLCFFKKAWADMEANSDYRQKSTIWWSAMLAGCPDVEADLPDALENKQDTEKLLAGMIFALGKANDVTDEQDEEEMAAKWAKTSTHTQCVFKLSRGGEWDYRELHIEKGIISWSSTERCNSGLVDQMRTYFGHTKKFAMQFLTAKVGEDPVQVYPAKINGKQNDQGCIGLQNPYRKFTFCAYEEGETMTRAKQVIDQHLEVLRNEREMLATAAKLERLVAEASSQGSDSQEVLKDMDETGDTTVDDLTTKLGSEHRMLGTSAEEQEAQKILDKIRKGSSLVESGQNITMGSMLLQEGYVEAHSHPRLSAVMEGRAMLEVNASALVLANDGVTGASAAAGSSGGISMTELLIILIICGGGFFCIGALGYMASRSLVQEEAEDDEHDKLKLPLGTNMTKEEPALSEATGTSE